jgi:hypothetical protein
MHNILTKLPNQEVSFLQLYISTCIDMYFQYAINLRTDDLLSIVTRHFILQLGCLLFY